MLRPVSCLRPRWSRHLAGALAMGAALTAPLGAQPAPIVGVVLSGGAAKGLSHIGVLQALEAAGVRVDVITGTSMGALVGGLYAIGYDADSLAAIARHIDWDAALADRLERRHLLPEQKRTDGRHLATLPLRGITPTLPTRLVGGHAIRQLLAELTWPAALTRDFRDLPIPFATVAVDIETGEPVVFTGGHLTDALTATMAIPGVFEPVVVDGRTLVDGGIIRNLPAQDAQALGADLLICSDVTEPLKTADELTSVFGVVNQALSLASAPTHADQVARCDILIEPDIDGISAFDFRAVDTWIARGRTAADAVSGALAALAARAPRGNGRPSRPSATARVVTGLDAPMTDAAHERLVRRRMNLHLPRAISATDMAEAMDRLYATNDFERVAYGLETDTGGTTRLVVRTEGEGLSSLGISARYEGTYKASLLLTATLQDRLGVGSRTMIDLRLGEQLRAAASWERRLGALTPWVIGLAGGYRRVPFDLYTDALRTETARLHLLDGAAFFGIAAGTSTLIGIDLRGEHARDVITTGAVGDSARESTYSFVTAGASATVDTRDAPQLPQRGVLLTGSTTWADRGVGSSATFRHHVVRANAAIPVGRRVSVLLRADLGAATGADLPPHYRFFLGGAVPYYLLPDRHLPFFGLRLQERSGRFVQVGGAGLQVRLPADFYVQALWNGGTVLENWDWDPDAWTHGVAASLAWKTPFGTARAYISGEAFEGPYRFDFDLGFAF